MATIPSYALYGTPGRDLLPEQIHCESIAERSRLYEWEIQPHRHEHFFQILYIRAGSGVALLEESRVELPRRSAVTVPPQAVHGFVFSRDVDGIVVTLNDSYLAGLLAAAPEVPAILATPRAYRLAGDARDPRAPAMLFEQLLAELGGISPWRGSAIGAVLTLLLIALARKADADMPLSSRKGGRVGRHFEQFQRLLEQGYRSARDIAAYAADLGITPTQLNRVCRQMAGRSALQLVHHRVLVEAQRDLLYSSLDIKQIAYTLGFADASYFTRFFVKNAGLTPTEFRRQARAKLRAPADS